MKNIHVLPTDKPSRLSKSKSKEELTFSSDIYNLSNRRHIYITSDEEIKEGNWVLCIDCTGRIRKANKLIVITSTKEQCWYYKKIILTDNSDLIKDGVQAIDYEFLEFFVKNPICKEVEIRKEKLILGEVAGTTYTDFNYKIIIPKEKPKQEFTQFGTKEFNDLASTYFGGKPKQETTLEEFIKKQLSLGKYQDQESAIRHSIELGAKWQQEQIGKSEFLQRLRATKSDAEARRLILEQFKNK